MNSAAANASADPAAPPAAPGPTADRASGRIECLDALRGAAALFVLWFHCYLYTFTPERIGLAGDWSSTATPITAPLLLFLPFQYGDTGVALFFVLSGFVIHYSVLRAEKLDSPAFLWRRFWRLYPAYLFALTAFVTTSFAKDPVKAAWTYLVFLLSGQNLFEWTYREVNSSFWSLAVEVQFYLLYPLFYAMRSRWGCGRALAATFVVCTLGRIAAACLQDWNKPLAGELWHNTQTLWFDWALGAYIAERWRDGGRVFQRPWLWVVVFAPPFLIAPFVKALHPLGFTFGSVLYAVLLEVALHGRVPTWRLARAVYLWLGSVGVYSYSLYLLHQPPILGIDAILRPIHGTDPKWQELDPTMSSSHPVLRMAVVGIATTCIFCLLAWFAHRTIELDGEALGRRLWKKIRPDPPRPPSEGGLPADGAAVRIAAAPIVAPPGVLPRSPDPPAADAGPRS